YTTVIPAWRAAASTRAVGSTTALIPSSGTPARANIPPSAPKSFCMSTTTTAVRAGSSDSGLGLASISIAETLTRAPPPAKRIPRAGDAPHLAERPRRCEQVVRRERHQLTGSDVAELGPAHAREPE